jgi:hypothetical protein
MIMNREVEGSGRHSFKDSVLMWKQYFSEQKSFNPALKLLIA